MVWHKIHNTRTSGLLLANGICFSSIVRVFNFLGGVECAYPDRDYAPPMDVWTRSYVRKTNNNNVDNIDNSPPGAAFVTGRTQTANN